MKILVLQSANIPGIQNWLKEEFGTKNNNEPFTTSDIQGYIKRKKLPSNLQGVYEIEKIEHRHSTPRYNIYKIG